MMNALDATRVPPVTLAYRCDECAADIHEPFARYGEDAFDPILCRGCFLEHHEVAYQVAGAPSPWGA